MHDLRDPRASVGWRFTSRNRLDSAHQYGTAVTHASVYSAHAKHASTRQESALVVVDPPQCSACALSARIGFAIPHTDDECASLSVLRAVELS